MAKRRIYYPVIQMLRDVRRDGKITQETLAKKAGYGRRTIISWEAFTRTPSLPALTVWCEALGAELTIKKPKRGRYEKHVSN